MTSKFIQDILAEMEEDLNKEPVVSQEENDNDEEINETQDINAIRAIIQKSTMDYRHALKRGNPGLADKIAIALKNNLESQGYNWKRDPNALEIIDEANNIDKKIASSGRGEQAQAQLNRVWSNAISKKDLSLMSDEELGAAVKSTLNDKSKEALINILAKGMELEAIPDPRDAGTFMRQRHIRDSKEYGNLNIMRESFIQELRVLLENEVEQAEVLMASKGFSEELQVMIEKLGRLMNEKLPPVIDQMRLAYGTEQADVFGETMRSDMQSILDTLLAVRENIDHAVVSISQGKMPHEETDMDADGNLTDTGMGNEMDIEPSSDLQNELGDLADEFGGDESMSGPEEDPLGRAKKESFEDLRKQLKEMRSQIAKVKNSSK